MHIQYHRKYGWDLVDSKAMLNFASKQSKQLKILSYGCHLDYKAIQKLIKDLSLAGGKRENENLIDINFESYDANSIFHNNHGYYIDLFNIEPIQLIEFENELHKLKSKHIRCDFNIRGHYEVQLDGKEYSTLVYKTIEFSAVYREALAGRYLFFIDNESEDNYEIRCKIHLLPENLQSLTLPLNITEMQKVIFIKDWIRQILAY